MMSDSDGGDLSDIDDFDDLDMIMQRQSNIKKKKKQNGCATETISTGNVHQRGSSVPNRSIHSIRAYSKKQLTVHDKEAASEVASPEMIPWGLLLDLRKELELRKRLETNENDNETRVRWEVAQCMIKETIRNCKRTKELPRGWKYNRANLSNLVAIDPRIVKKNHPKRSQTGLESHDHYVKKDEHKNIYDVQVKECKYIKATNAYYYFTVTIQAFEERKLGVYEAKVRLKMDDGSKTLGKIFLMDRKPLGM
ncbi:hypothetical protein Tco_1136259 [Tanacetum coccineum]